MKVRIPNQGGSQAEMLRKLQQMQADIQAKQAELSEREYDVEAGGGAVKVRIDGNKKVLSVKISPDVIDPEDVEMLEDLITAAINEAITVVDKTSEEELGKITGEMNLPNMPGMF